MFSNTKIFTPRARIFGKRGPLFTPGYTPMPDLQRVLEDGALRITEEGHYRVSERNTVISIPA